METLVERMRGLRERGNGLLETKGQAPAALKVYMEAAALAAEAYAEEGDVDAEVREEWASALKNQAAAELKLMDWEAAEASATRAMEVEGETVKALYRRAVARRKQDEFEAAYEDLQAAMRLDPREAVLRQEMLQLKQAYMAAERAERGEDGVDRLLSVEASLPVSVEAVAKAVDAPFYAATATRGRPETLMKLKAAAAEIRLERVRCLNEPASCESVAGKENGDDKAFYRRSGDGNNDAPWFLDVRIEGLETSAYKWPTVFRLVFSDEWPAEPPKIRASTLLSHCWFDGPRHSHNAHHARRATVGFYERLMATSTSLKQQRDEGVVFDLSEILFLMRQSLDGPPIADTDGVSSTRPFGSVDPALVAAWKRHARQQAARFKTIEAYMNIPNHPMPEIFSKTHDESPELDAAVWNSLSPSLKKALTEQDPRKACEVVSEGVWAFDLFPEHVAARLLEEIDFFYASKLPASRPNSMNRYGVIVNDVGMEPFIRTLQRLVYGPIARVLFGSPENNVPNSLGHPASGFDSNHAFIVKYRLDEDPHLDVHTDDSDVTFNVSLGRPGFQGSNLIFCGMLGASNHRQHSASYDHKIGRCVVHLGNRRHGTDDIVKGERLNLIVWNHSLAWRESPAASAHNRDFHQEAAEPDPRCVSYTHDRDFANFKDYPSREREAEFRGRGWCPPPGAEYPGFQPEGRPS